MRNAALAALALLSLVFAGCPADDCADYCTEVADCTVTVGGEDTFEAYYETCYETYRVSLASPVTAALTLDACRLAIAEYECSE